MKVLETIFLWLNIQKIAIIIIAILIIIFSALSLADEKKVTLAFEEVPPYAYYEDGEIIGFYPDLLKAIYKDSGYKVQMKILPPKRSNKWCEQGIIDGVVGIADGVITFEGEVFSEKIYEASIHPIVLHETNIKYQTIEDLISYKIGVVGGVGFEHYYPKLTFEAVGRAEQNLQRLFKKRIDVILEDPVIINYLAKTKYDHMSYKILSPPIITINISAGFSSYPILDREKFSLFNRGLDRIRKKGVYKKLASKWDLINLQ